MDEMKLKLSTRFMRGIVAKFIAKSLRKKFDTNVDIELNELEITTMNDKIYIHASLDGEITKEEFEKLIKTIIKD